MPAVRSALSRRPRWTTNESAANAQPAVAMREKRKPARPIGTTYAAKPHPFDDPCVALRDESGPRYLKESPLRRAFLVFRPPMLDRPAGPKRVPKLCWSRAIVPAVD